MSRAVDTGSGTRLAYRESGPPDGPVMVLLHALGESCASWDVVGARFADRYRMLAFDLPGHGASDRSGDYSVARMSRDVEGALDTLVPGGFVLVGHSLGGMVALTLTVRRPDLVGRLVLEDVAPPRARPRRPVPERPETDLPFDWEVVVAARAEMDDGDDALWEALPSVRPPVLVVAGGPDSTVDQTRLAQAAQRMPHAELVTIRAGHMVHHERPDEFAAAVLTWLSA